MYRGVVRTDLHENEMQPYREVDVQLLVLAQTQSSTTSVDLPKQEEEEPLPEEIDMPPLPNSTLAPLLLLNVAQEQASTILTQARQDAEALQRDTYQHAVTLGREEGKEALQHEVHSLVASCENMQQQLRTLEQRLTAQLTPEIVRLALAIAEKIVGREVEEDRLLIASVLEHTLIQVQHARQVHIWLHPADHETLQQFRPDLIQAGEEGQRTIVITSSEEVSRGGCRIETELGAVDATIPVQLEEIREQLLHD